MTADKGEKKPTPWYIEIPVVVVLTVVFMIVIQALIGRIYLIPSQSDRTDLARLCRLHGRPYLCAEGVLLL